FKNFEDMDLICSQEATVRFNLHGGIHTHMNVVFDKLSQLSFTIHGLLVVLQPALRSFPDKSSLFKKILPNWWTKTNVPTLESVIFGKAIKKKLAADGKSSVIEGKYLQHAYRFLSALRSCLLLSYDGFYSYFSSVSETLPSPCKLELENLNMKARLSDLQDKVTEIEDPSDLAEAINACLLELSGLLLNLWGTFLQFSFKREMEAFIEEKAREEKIGKLFFSTQHPRQGALTYDEKITQSHKQIYKEVKKSPRDSCSLECPGMDCVVRSPPAIFEDRYLDPNEGLQPICDGDTLIQVLNKFKEELNRLIDWSLCGECIRLAPRNLYLRLVLDNGSDEGIRVHFRMSQKNNENKQIVFLSFRYGSIGGRTDHLEYLGSRVSTVGRSSYWLGPRYILHCWF
ncbi:protein FAM135A-like, partial [Xenopus tropicalis]|uniref:Protein FAM135A-like n=1 Tax=Xenopus tropicalis TaxID=8364 RepID=A0A8J0T5W3_XENTR